MKTGYNKNYMSIDVSVLTTSRVARKSGVAARQESNPQSATSHTTNVMGNCKNTYIVFDAYDKIIITKFNAEVFDKEIKEEDFSYQKLYRKAFDNYVLIDGNFTICDLGKQNFLNIQLMNANLVIRN